MPLYMSDGDDDGRFPTVGGCAANTAGRLQGASEEGPARSPAQQQGQADGAAEGSEQPQGPAGRGEDRSVKYYEAKVKKGKLCV